MVFLRKGAKYSQEQLWRLIDDKKYMLKGACNGYLHRVPARTLYIGRQMVAATIGLSLGSPMEDLEGGLEALKGFAAQWEEQ